MLNYSFDYWITLPETPAFQENIKIMIDHIEEDGESPTIYRNENGNAQSSANGTSVSSGKGMLNFRLPFGLDESELLAYLDEGMSNPKPPLTVESIRSSYLIQLPPDDPDDPDEEPKPLEYIILYPANKAKFLPFMNGNPSINDDIFLSGYSGTQAIEL